MDSRETRPKIRLSHRGRSNIWTRLASVAFHAACLGATLLCVVSLFALIGAILYHGTGRLSWSFLTSLPSRHVSDAGIWIPLVDSVLLIACVAAFCVPTGIATAIYLEEYASDNWWVRLVRTNIANLAGVPSIVYGMLGLGLFAQTLHMGRSLAAGALTLGLMVLPVVIIAAREAIQAVPPSLRRASYALGATRWQTVYRQVLPMALPGIMTGVILALSRALGEAAPLIVVGAVSYVAFLPQNPFDDFTALPIQIYEWTRNPRPEFHDLAASGIIVLLAVLLCLNGFAVWIRHHFAKHLSD
jgi:phosphate transport system permease protein